MRRVPGHMNKTEQRYSEHLDRRRAMGELLWWAFEPWKLRLGPDCQYQVDFGLMLADFTIECHEIKGHMEDDARVKIAVAAGKFPFRFVVVRKDGDGWNYREVKL